MKYLLDTCVLSDFARGNEHTIERIQNMAPVELAISSITAMEIEVGLALNPSRARRLAPVMHALLDAIDILPFSIDDGRATAIVCAALQKRGRPIGAYDLLVAGSALARHDARNVECAGIFGRQRASHRGLA